MQHAIYRSDQTDPFYNLAVEDMLFSMQSEGCTLYLWQNQNTVVIGKNQNAWKECRVQLLEQEGGRLARRSSGGGAVFHDLGNLNFTFLLPRKEYDVRRQLGVVQSAARAFGVETAFTGRNDLVISHSGAKFSGNAFRFSKTTALHHGTILVDVDMHKLSRYLAPSQEKLAAKGVQSVRARVENLAACNADITIASMRSAMMHAFIEAYGPAQVADLHAFDEAALHARTTEFSSWEWRMGAAPAFDIVLEERFLWGGIELQLQLTKGHIAHAQVYSDAMDEAMIARIAPALLGCAFRAEEMAAHVRNVGGAEAAEIADWLEAKEF
ncbi:lipoate--protein ligase [Christensenellaceae bacterium OttesenSCG-928-L17]|nr:lipoate--protein ligase [Christensenellaceae bacterium OttesenSCG-928-L17]